MTTVSPSLLASLLLVLCFLPGPFLVGVSLSLVGAGSFADVSVDDSSSKAGDGERARSFEVVARYRDRLTSNRDDDVILIERDTGVDRGEGVLSEDSEGLHRAVRQAGTNRMELLLVLDRTAYNRFLTRNNNDVAATRMEIDRYFAGVVDAVNGHLAKVDTPLFSVRAILTEIYVLTEAQSAVTDDLDGNNDGIINADIALTRFTAFANSTLRLTRPHDYVLLITGYDLRRANGNNVVGVTYQSKVCTDRKQGIMEEEGDEMISATMAHEIGHTLGAVHDQQGNVCPDAFFTMSAVAGVPVLRSQASNPFSFSVCSRNEIRSFLGNVVTSCLRSRQTTPGSEVDIAALTTVPLGQQYNADQQCINSVGPTSRFCRDQYNSLAFNFEQDMCYDLRCELPSGGCFRTLPFKGTSCGSGKWCVEGSCVPDPRAPLTPSPTCPQGDQPSANCSPSSCLVEQLRRFQCCATCSPPIPTPNTTPVSVHGVQSTTPPTTQSIDGVTPGTPEPVTSPALNSVSIDGVQPGTTTTDAGPSPTLSMNGTRPPPAPDSTLSIFGVKPETTRSTDHPERTMSIFGVQPETATPTGHPGPTMSIFGVQPETATPTNRPGPTMSIFGIQPDTAMPTGHPGPTMSVFGVQPDTATPTNQPGPTLSIFGVQPETATPTNQPGPTISIFGVQPETATPTNHPGPTMSLHKAIDSTGDPASPTMSVNGSPTAADTTSGPTDPTMSVDGVTRGSITSPTGSTLSIDRVQTSTTVTQGPTGPTMSIDSVTGGPTGPTTGPTGSTLSVEGTTGTAGPTGPTMSFGGTVGPTGPTLSVPGGNPTTATTAVSVA